MSATRHLPTKEPWVLHDPYLRTKLSGCHAVVAVLLAARGRRASPRDPGYPYRFDSDYTEDVFNGFSTTSVLYQGHYISHVN